MRVRVSLCEFRRKPAAAYVERLRSTYPSAEFVLWTDLEERNPLFDRQILWPGATATAGWAGPQDHQRWPWRANDLCKAFALEPLHDTDDADVMLAFDGDMWVHDIEAARALPELAQAHGLCLPANPRQMAKRDAEIGADSAGPVSGPAAWTIAYNCGVMAASGHHPVVKMFIQLMRAEPQRGPRAWTKAHSIMSRASVAVLPRQWCVCADDCGILDPVILHGGHELVRRRYNLGSPS